MATPSAGLQDFFVAVSTSFGKVHVAVVGHRFTAHSVDSVYGSEVDALVSVKTSWQQLIALKVAAYAADEFSADTTKAMLFTTYGF